MVQVTLTDMPAADTAAATVVLTAPDMVALTAPDTAATDTAMEVCLWLNEITRDIWNNINKILMIFWNFSIQAKERERAVINRP